MIRQDVIIFRTKIRMRLALLAPVWAEELGRVGCGRRSGEGEPAGRMIRVSMSRWAFRGSTETVKIDWQIQRQIAKVSKTMHPWRAWRHWFILVLLAASVEYAVWCKWCFQKVEEFMSIAPVVGDVGDDARSSAPVAAFCFMPLRIGCTKMYQDDPSCTTLIHIVPLSKLATTSTMSVQSTSDILWLSQQCALRMHQAPGKYSRHDCGTVNRSVIGKTHCSSQPGDLLATIA